MPIPTTFDNLKNLRTQGEEAVVLLGCGGDLNEWVTGVLDLWKQRNIVSPDFGFTQVLQVTTTGGRVDLALLFDWRGVNVGALTGWRLTFGDTSWLSDYVVNYADHHGYFYDGHNQ